MPSRNRRSHRQPSSDIEDPSTQAEARDDVEEQPRRTKKSKSRRQQDSDDEVPAADQDNANDEDDVIDVENFGDHPLTEAEANRLRGFAGDWSQMAGKIDQCLRGPADAAGAVADSLEGEKMENTLVELERVMKELIDVQAEMNIHHTVLNDLYQRASSHEKITDGVAQYDASVARLVEEYQQKTTRKKYARVDAFKNFKESIWNAQHSDNTAMPPITDFIPKEQGDDSDSDEELEIGGVTQDFKCPLTLRVLENPLTSRLCGHSFSESALKEMFRRSTGTKACPAAGCNKEFKLSDCVPDKSLAKKVKLWERRQRRRQEEMDDGEVID